MDDLGFNCTVCEEYYSNDRLPRNLTCGHSVCSFCIGRILATDKKCPECRMAIRVSHANELPINYPLLKLTLTLVHKQPPIPQTQEPLAPPVERSVGTLPVSSALYDNADECTEHRSRLYFRCMTCDVLVCEVCLASGHMSPPQGECRTLPIVQALQEMKRSHQQKATSKIQFAEKLKRRLEKEITALDGLREQKKRTTDCLQTLLQEVEIIVTSGDVQREEASRRVATMQELMDILKDSKKCVKEASIAGQMKPAMDKATETLSSVEKQILQEHHRQTFSTPLITSLNRQNLRGLIEAIEKSIFVHQYGEDLQPQHRWAKVTERDGLLHLHALHSLEEHPNGIILPYDVIRKLVPQESPSVFMDISQGSRNLKGRVHVRMFGNTIRSQQALYLCSGEKGPSYKETCFYKVDNLGRPLEILRGGDYENNNGTGGCSILNGITSGGMYKTQITAGLMVGWPVNDYWRLGAFDFYLKDCKERYDNSGYGYVTKGLEILKAAARHSPVQDSMIKDCGLIIPL